ncbi:MAG: TetR/AcrR family transcriptional regulator [Actinomycetota bacterium]|nr:TetR/AcrR family transcriptional regulator [Actinomycetota bacterium]
MATHAAENRPVGRSDEARARILQSAVRVLRARGFDSTRIADVARDAGVSSGLVIYHFQTRELVLSAALRYAEEQFLQQIESALDGVEGAGARLKLFLERTFHLEDSDDLPPSWVLWPAMWEQALRSPEVRRDREELDRRLRNVIADVVRHGQAAGTFADVDPDLFARMLSAMTDGLAISVVLEDPTLPADEAIALCLRLCDAELGPGWV